MMGNNDNQDFLKKLDHLDRAGQKIMHRLAVTLYVVLACGILAATVYCGVREFRGNGNSEQLVICCTMLLAFAAIPVCSKLADRLSRRLDQKNTAFDPPAMELPKYMPVTLEDALHRMSTQTGVIVWDGILGCVAFSLLFVLTLGMGNRPRVLFACACVVVLIAVGHTVLHLLWKKKSFTKRMLRNTAEVITLECPEAYAEAVEESLKRDLLLYEKEVVLTNEYILGNAERDIWFTPVAIPRVQVTEFVFFYRRMVTGGKNSRTLGILRCNANGKKLVDLVLGRRQRAEQIKRILSDSQISWQEDELNYI